MRYALFCITYRGKEYHIAIRYVKGKTTPGTMAPGVVGVVRAATRLPVGQRV